VNIDRLGSSRHLDFDLLANGGSRFSRALFTGCAIFLGLIFGIVFTLYAIHQYRGEVGTCHNSQQGLLALDTDWAVDMVNAEQKYSGWLQRHGTSTEASIFEDMCVILSDSALSVAASSMRSDGSLPFFSSLSISLHGGSLRLLFLLIASFRLWMVVIMGAVVYGINCFKPYLADDMLGQTGNGRLFYSGIQADLKDLAPSGAPDTLVRGLVCLDAASVIEVKRSAMWRVLNEYGATISCTEALVAVILKYGSTEAFVSPAGEETLLSNSYAGAPLSEHTAHVLNAALSLHALYVAGDIRSVDREPPEDFSDHPLSAEEYGHKIRQLFNRVLTPEMRRAIAQSSATEVATAVLAIESGKILGYSLEAGRWVRRSNFNHLNARAVLHSITEFPLDFNLEIRSRIRRAIIFASRSSAFAPVRMPIDLTDHEWALRQWMEILLTYPYEIDSMADEIEMVGLVRVAQQRWSSEFLDAAFALSPEMSRVSFATPSNLLLVPLSKVISLLRKTLTEAEIRRLEALVSDVSTRHRFRALEAQSLDQPSPETALTERIFPLISDAEIRTLSTLHQLPPDEVRDWSVFRIVLYSSGWLARRVGDYTVPESSVIFAVFKSDGTLTGANDLGFLGQKGMVPFRGAKLEARWGRSWGTRFVSVAGVTMAETQEDYDKLLRGIDDRDEEEPLEAVAPVTA